MPLKDHYKTLELPALAGAGDIKQAYRRLVRKYHPDKSSNEQTVHLFHEIQEAYEVLSDPARRKTYDNELKHAGRYTAYNKDQVNNAEQVVKQAKDLHRYVHSIDNRSLNYDALTDFILGILNKENIALLMRADNAGYITSTIDYILQSSKNILAVRSFSEIAERLNQLKPNSSERVKIAEELSTRKRKEKQNWIVPYASMLIVLLVIAAMCLILFL
jgi:curved DNA-binding protein CbpA